MQQRATELGAAAMPLVGGPLDDREELRTLGELAAAGDPDACDRLFVRGIEVVHLLARRLAVAGTPPTIDRLVTAGIDGLRLALDLSRNAEAALQLRLGAAAWIAAHVHRAMRRELEAAGHPARGRR